MEYFHENGVPRDLLLSLYHSAIQAVDGRRCVAEQLVRQPLGGRIRAVAIGKAAASMLEGARDAVPIEQALLITKPGHAPVFAAPGTEIIEAGHPVPDAHSLMAGQRLLAFLATAPEDTHWLFLISGGASSLVEVLPDGLTLADLQQINQWLLASGLPIEQMNVVRGRVSLVKGGKLCGYLRGRPAYVLLISDVPGDAPSIIGSGLLVLDPPGRELPPELPGWLESLFSRLPATRPATDCGGITTHIVARLDQALAAAASRALALGWPVHRYPERLAGEAAEVGRGLASRLLDADPGVHLWGGETTVTLPEHPGQGGRCQQLALAAAERIAGNDRITLLAAGTDGSDGPSDVAGACVDGGTLLRGRHAGLDAQQALAAADAGRFLDAAGDLLETGPTGTNVTDLVIAFKSA